MQTDFTAVDAILTRYRGKHGAMIPLLQAVQQHEGYLSREVMRYIAEQLEVPAAEIYGVATFYSMFRLKPQGKHIIRVCKGTACHVSGANGIVNALRENLKLTADEDTTADMQFTLMEVACLGCCSLAPVIMVDDQTYGKLTPESISGIVSKYAY